MIRLNLDQVHELGLADLALADTAVLGRTDRGPFRLEVYAPGIVRLTIGTATLPYYGLGLVSV